MSLEVSRNTATELLKAAEDALHERFQYVEVIARRNQQKVLDAFHAERVSAIDLSGTTGYGLDDEGRDKLERVFARVFETEAAIVRSQIISGTHALRLAMFGVVRPGHHIVFATGTPYDTLEAVVGIRPAIGSLAEWGVSHSIVPLNADGYFDTQAITAALQSNTKLVMFQKSRGYQDRLAFSAEDIRFCVNHVRQTHPGVCFAVDNSYGEFVEAVEPTAVGADLAIGSLIKNAGGGIAPTGGYIAGRKRYIEQIGAQVTAPGVGLEAGPTHDFLRPLYQGLFLAPHTVSQAIKGSLLAAHVLPALGYRVSPSWFEPRRDLVLAIDFGSRDALLRFCQCVQASAPVDAHVVPQAAPMPGYASDVVMAAGTFIQGGSLEMSADGPMRPPFTGYFQGGLTYEHVYLTIERFINASIKDRGVSP